MDFDRYNQEFLRHLEVFVVIDVNKQYQLPNDDELHNMICGYKHIIREDLIGFNAVSMDYFNYEKGLWKQE